MTASIQALEIPSPTGQVLRGQQYGGGVNLAILVHAPGGDLDRWGNLPLHLADGDLTVVSFDLPGHGLSDDPWKPDLLSDSIQAVVDWGRRQHATRIFLVVAKASVPSALQVAAEGGVDALVVLSPPEISDDPDLVDGRIAALPKLLLVGAGRERDLLAAQRFSRRCIGWTVLSTLLTCKQGTDLLAGPWGRQVAEQIATFLRDYQLFNRRSGASGGDDNERNA